VLRIHPTAAAERLSSTSRWSSLSSSRWRARLTCGRRWSP